MADERKLDPKARTALWYAIEQVFGGEHYDNMGNAFWSAELEAVESRARKRLRLLKLVPGDNIPKVLQQFIIETATDDQLMHLAEEASFVAAAAGYAVEDIRKFKVAIERAFREGGIEAKFSQGGKLTAVQGVDTTVTPLADLPVQKQFKADVASRVENQIGVLMADLDNFKAVNDTNGHQAGDACLAKVVEIMGSCILGKGKLYRYGGDEFAIVLENADVNEAAATGDRIRRSIEAAKPGGEITVTASIGVAASDQEGLRDPEALIKAADDSAYSSKRSGKNVVTAWRSESEAPAGPRRTPSATIARLVELAECAVHGIQNDPQDVSDQELAIAREAWESDVLASLGAAGAPQSDISWFRVLGTYTPKNLAGRTVARKKLLNEVAEKIERLREITQRLEDHYRRR